MKNIKKTQYDVLKTLGTKNGEFPAIKNVPSHSPKKSHKRKRLSPITGINSRKISEFPMPWPFEFIIEHLPIEMRVKTILMYRLVSKACYRKISIARLLPEITLDGLPKKLNFANEFFYRYKIALPYQFVFGRTGKCEHEFIELKKLLSSNPSLRNVLHLYGFEPCDEGVSIEMLAHIHDGNKQALKDLFLLLENLRVLSVWQISTNIDFSSLVKLESVRTLLKAVSARFTFHKKIKSVCLDFDREIKKPIFVKFIASKNLTLEHIQNLSTNLTILKLENIDQAIEFPCLPSLIELEGKDINAPLDISNLSTLKRICFRDINAKVVFEKTISLENLFHHHSMSLKWISVRDINVFLCIKDCRMPKLKQFFINNVNAQLWMTPSNIDCHTQIHVNRLNENILILQKDNRLQTVTLKKSVKVHLIDKNSRGKVFYDKSDNIGQKKTENLIVSSPELEFSDDSWSYSIEDDRRDNVRNYGKEKCPASQYCYHYRGRTAPLGSILTIEELKQAELEEKENRLLECIECLTMGDIDSEFVLPNLPNLKKFVCGNVNKPLDLTKFKDKLIHIEIGNINAEVSFGKYSDKEKFELKRAEEKLITALKLWKFMGGQKPQIPIFPDLTFICGNVNHPLDLSYLRKSLVHLETGDINQPIGFVETASQVQEKLKQIICGNINTQWTISCTFTANPMSGYIHTLGRLEKIDILNVNAEFTIKHPNQNCLLQFKSINASTTIYSQYDHKERTIYKHKPKEGLEIIFKKYDWEK